MSALEGNCTITRIDANGDITFPPSSPERPAHSFDGWNTAGRGAGTQVAHGTPNLPAAFSPAFYADWIPSAAGFKEEWTGTMVRRITLDDDFVYLRWDVEFVAPENLSKTVVEYREFLDTGAWAPMPSLTLKPAPDTQQKCKVPRTETGANTGFFRVKVLRTLPVE